MKVKKRGNRGTEDVSFDKIIKRISDLAKDLKDIDPTRVAQETIRNIKDMISTRDLDLISAAIADSMRTISPNYGVLAARIYVNNLHKETPAKFSESFLRLAAETNIIAPWATAFVAAYKEDLDRMVVHDNDYNFDYFGLKTLEQGYLQKIHSKKGMIIWDRPQYIYMRVAIHLYCPQNYFDGKDVNNSDNDIDIASSLGEIKECYKVLSQQTFTHATPTLFNSCTKIGQLMSCFLFGSHDSIEGITHCLSNVAKISKTGGGIGVHMSMIRSQGQLIRGTNGKSGGLIPQLKIYDAAITCFNQGGKRNGSMAVYIETWHSDVFEFLLAKSQVGNEAMRARNLFYALLVNSLFVQRVEADRKALASNESRVLWSLFSEDDCPGLSDSYGEEFNKLYVLYENDAKYTRQVPANDLFTAILVSMLETGGPYILHKEHINYKSNQANIGTIKSSNLCAEIVQYSDHENYAVCCLSSISLPAFIKAGGPRGGGLTPANICDFYDFTALAETVKTIVKNLNKVLDRNNYPTPETKKSAMETRAIGIGTQGLADVFMLGRIPFIGAAAAAIDRAIQETIYFAACSASADLAAKDGPYFYFKNSPAAAGILQPDLCAINERRMAAMTGDQVSSTISRADERFCPLWDWDALRVKVKKFGLRNSLLCANMPTGSTSQILGNFETTEPPTSNCFNRSTLAGLFTIVNRHLYNHLNERNLWSEEIMKEVIAAEGSIQTIKAIPADIKDIYKTVWEIDRKQLLIRAAMRGAFIDQSQSLNIYIPAQWKKDLNGNVILDDKGAKIDIRSVTLAQVFLAGWRYGLKTGSYYIRSTAKVNPLAVGINAADLRKKGSEKKNADNEDPVCRREEGCTVCSS